MMGERQQFGYMFYMKILYDKYYIYWRIDTITKDVIGESEVRRK